MRCLFILLAFCCLAFVSACTTTSLKPVTDTDFTELEGDERGLWKRSAEQAKRMNESGFLYDDKQLEHYVNAIAKKLQPPSLYERIPFTVRVIRDPSLNAFALPNGAVYLHTGILASMDNEAQLAALLAHEMTHATNRHAVRQLRNTKNTSGVFAAIFAATGGLGAVFLPVAQASVTGYSRDLEREADREGFSLVEKAGYDVTESVKLFEQMKREVEDEEVKETYFFSSHPRIVERIESYNELIAARTMKEQQGVKNEEVFRSRTKKLFLDNARLDIELGRYERAVSGLERYIERYPADAEAYYLSGEANRQLGDAEHGRKAAEQYRKALSLDPTQYDAHKMLGTMSYKTGDLATAKEHLQRYLVLNPKASDRAYIEKYIRACDQQGQKK